MLPWKASLLQAATSVSVISRSSQSVLLRVSFPTTGLRVCIRETSKISLLGQVVRKHTMSTSAKRRITREEIIVSASWLHDNINNTNVVPVDASWFLNIDPSLLNSKGQLWDASAGKMIQPPKPRFGKAEYLEKHIPRARYFDIDTISDQLTQLPHMLPSSEDFAEHMSQLGIRRDDHIVIYDSVGFFSTPRVYWTFRVFKHPKISILDGGLPKWIEHGFQVVSGEEMFEFSKYEDNGVDESLVTRYATLDAHVRDFAFPDRLKVVDARPKARFEGLAPEPRPGVPRGHVPNAVNIPFTSVSSQNKTLVSSSEIQQIFKKAGVDLSRDTVFMCGSGVTACALFVAAESVGAQGAISVYDGSWTEWSSKRDAPKIEPKLQDY